MARAAVHPRKSRIVEELRAKLLESRVVGLANVSGIPAPQMQSIRAGLRGKADLQVVKNRLLLRAIQAASQDRKGIEGLQDFVEGQMAMVLTDSNPFKLFKELEGTKTRAPARGGEVAPEDIAVREGDTPFKPGPVVGDLQKAGIPAAIERGKVVIKRDKVLVEAGRRIPREVAQVLSRLEILPLTVGLDLRGVFEDGSLFSREVLAVDEDALRRDLIAAAHSALSLALEIAFPTEATIRPLLAEAHHRALAVGMAASYPTVEILPTLLSKAHSQVVALASRIPDALGGDMGELTPSSEKGEAVEEQEATDGEEKEEEGEDEASAGLSSQSK